MQNRQSLEQLLSGVTKARDELAPANIVSHKPKLVLKIAPDLNETQLAEMAEVIRASGIDGVIVSNTTISRPSSLSDRKSHFLVVLFQLFIFNLLLQPTNQRQAVSPVPPLKT